MVGLVKQLFYKRDMSKVMSKMRELKHLLKRIEFVAGDSKENVEMLLQNYSVDAIKQTIWTYCVEKEMVWNKIINR